MLLPQEFGAVAQERMRSWDKEIEHQQMLAQISSAPPRWRRWTGSGMVRLGFWLMRGGERMARREY